MCTCIQTDQTHKHTAASAHIMCHTHLGVLKHAQVGVHAERTAVLPTSPVESGGLMELALIRVNVCEEELVIILTPPLPLLDKHTHRKMHFIYYYTHTPAPKTPDKNTCAA